MGWAVSLSTASSPNDPEVRHDGTGIPIRWHDNLQSVPEEEGVPSIILAQEFFDCLPVRQFQFTEKVPAAHASSSSQGVV